MHVFLDLDGTLTDSKPGITRSFAHALKMMGVVPPPLDELTWVIGPALIDSFAKFDVDDPQVALDHYREMYAGGALFENSVYAGIPEALGAMKGSGLKLYLATAKAHVHARKITARFELADYLSQEFGPELDGTRKNKGDLLTYALGITGINAEDSVMVGDRIHDIEAARFVGMRSVGVTWGYGPLAETSQAEVLCENPGELPAVVAELFSK